MTYGALVVLLVLVLLALGWFISWWFLLALPLLFLVKLPMLYRRARVMAILAREYQYEFPAKAPQAYTLNDVERTTRKQKLTDYEIATLFMAVMCNSLFSDSPDVRAFCEKVHYNAIRLHYVDKVISADIFTQLSDVVQSKIGG